MTAPSCFSRIDKVVELCRGLDVLDVGCVVNVDIFHARIVNAAKSALGLDIDGKGIERLRQMGFEVVHGDAQNFCLDRKFDVIVCAEVMEHLKNPGAFLECAKKHLRPNGRLVITVPNAYYTHLLFHHSTVGEAYYWIFCEGTLRSLFEGFNYNVERIEYCDCLTQIFNPLLRKAASLFHRISFKFKFSGALLAVAKPRRGDE